MNEKKRIYISLPISGREESARIHAKDIADKLHVQGYNTLSPFESNVGSNPTYNDNLAYDIRAMLNYCDGIYMCEGWEKSFGCNVEFQIAKLIVRFGKKKDFEIMFEQ